VKRSGYAQEGLLMTAPQVEADDTVRRIIHVDMDAFYASVEQRDDPALRGKAVAVGGSKLRGVVAAASYEARRFGVRSAMPSVTAKRKCPDLIFVKPRFEVYKAVSQQIREIFSDYTPAVEPLSLDEAYLDVTDLRGAPSATAIAEEIRHRIRQETGLTASAGVSYNKFLAKIASDYRKPDGLYVITPRMGPEFVEALPVGKFHGVGPATARRMQQLGLETGHDIKHCTLQFLQTHFGKAGGYYYSISRGVCHRQVKPHRIRKSLGAERTFFTDLHTLAAARDALQEVLDKVWRHCEQNDLRARTLTLKVKYSDFQQITRSRTAGAPIGSRSELEALSDALLTPVFPLSKAIRLLGLSLSSFARGEQNEAGQFALAL
jgi:DNA polymerase-4